MKKVLLVTDVDFWELSSGHRVRIASLVNYLSVNFSLTVVNTGPAFKNIEELLAENYRAEFVILEKKKHLNSDEYGRKLNAFLKTRHFDTVIIEYIHCSYFLNFLIEDCQVILDTHDIVSERSEQFKKFNYRSVYNLSKTDESKLFDIYDNIIMISDAEFEKACLMTDKNKVLLCPHPLNITRHGVKAKVQTIAFVASKYLPNKDAINYFVKNCWGKIISKYDVELSIYGTVCDGLRLENYTKIKIQGFVRNLDKIYDDADIVINPVRFGAGLKIKNLEALAHGKPLVTTAHGAIGIESGSGNAYLLANTDGEFLSAISKLIENHLLRIKLQDEAQRFIERHFSAASCFTPLRDSINNYNCSE